MSATGKIVGVTAQSVMRWIRQMHTKYITEKPDIATVTEVEIDEIYHFFQKKLKGYHPKNCGSGKPLIIEPKNSSDGHWVVVLPKH